MALRLVKVNDAETALEFQQADENTFHAVSVTDFGNMAPAHQVVKEDLSEFCALCPVDPNPCPADMCPDGMGGFDPSMAGTVTGASGTITWMGETWVLPGESGVTKCVCPDMYSHYTLTGGLNTYTSHETWRKTATATPPPA